VVSVILIRVINVQSFGWTIHFSWNLVEIAIAAGLAIASAVAASWFPAWQAARSPIAEVLTDE